MIFFFRPRISRILRMGIRFAHSLTSSRVSFSLSLMRKRSNISKDFQKDYEKISIKIPTENLSENVSTILSLWVGQSPQNPNWKSTWKSQLKIDEWTLVFFFSTANITNSTNRESASRIPWLRRGSMRLPLTSGRQGLAQQGPFAWFDRFAVFSLRPAGKVLRLQQQPK